MKTQPDTVRIVIEGEESLPASQRQQVCKQLQHVLACAQLPTSWLFVTFVAEQRMRQLNKQWRNVDRSTDVLSFVAQTDTCNADSYPVLGDMVICPAVAARQAKQFGHTLCEEIAVLAVHGATHLLGFDHEQGGEAAVKQLQQEQLVLRAAGFNDALALTGRHVGKISALQSMVQRDKLQQAMPPQTADFQDCMQLWQSFVQHEGLKFTKQREQIAQAFFRLTSHVTAEQMLQTVRKTDPHVSLATVYRTLKLLQQCGLARGHRFDSDQACFEPNTDRHNPHDHLICKSCSYIVEFNSKLMETLQESIANQHGFRITHRRVEFYGICQRCKQQQTHNVKGLQKVR
ncbi:MAG: rRNA maturation RNase YbeY [Myxococcota bacterium]